jgi:rubrerythrin
MEGGIRAWKGWVTEGVPESGMAYFSSDASPEELMALAWYLEDGSRKFYSKLASMVSEGETGALYEELARAEEGHKASLLDLYKEFSGLASDPGFPGAVVSPEPEGEVMEGGVRLSEALQWAKGKKVTELLEFSIALESYSYDLYLKMERRMKDSRSARVLRLLSGEEKKHLERLSSLLGS